MYKSLDEVVLFQIEKTSKTAKAFSQRIFDERGLGLTIDQWVLLKMIHENPDISQKHLAELAVRDPASITRTLDLLDKKALISRNPGDADRRQYKVKLSKEGSELVQSQMPLVADHRAQSLKGFTKDEEQQLLSFLQRIQSNME